MASQIGQGEHGFPSKLTRSAGCTVVLDWHVTGVRVWRAMQYCKRFNRFENVEAVKAVRDLLSRVEESFGEGRYFYDFEVRPAFAPFDACGGTH